MTLIVLNKLIVEGDQYRRTIKFDKGLNIIQGDKYSGKSSVLSLIDYAFGKKSGSISANVQKELYEYCSHIMLELSYGNLTMTFKRYLWKDKSIIEVFFCASEDIKNFSPKTLQLEDFSLFLLSILNIPEFKLLKHIQHSKEFTVETLSFRDLFRYVYINQHELGTPSFMGLNLYPIKNKNKTIFEILFGFLDYDSENLVNKIKELENERVGIEEQIKGLTSYLNEQQFKSREDIQQIYNELSEQINEFIQRKNSLLYGISNKEQKTENIYSKINNHLNELEEKYAKLRTSKNNVNVSIVQKEKLILDYYNELNELLAEKEANEILPIMEHHYMCPLCKQQVAFDENIITHQFSINDAINNLKDKINTAQKSIAYSTLLIQKHNKSIAQIIEERTMYENAQIEYRQSIQTPYIPEIETLNKIINDLSERQTTINEGIKIFNKIEEKQRRIDKIAYDIANYKQKQAENKIIDEDKQKALHLLERRYKSYLMGFKQKVNDNAYIDRTTYLPFYDSAGLQEHDSGGMFLCMQVAYLLGILFTKKINNGFGHPGFMMFDTISKYLGTIKATETEIDTDAEKILDPEVYEKIYTILSRVGNVFQIIVVENTPPPTVSDKVKYTFHTGEHGLIDLSKNEK